MHKLIRFTKQSGSKLKQFYIQLEMTKQQVSRVYLLREDIGSEHHLQKSSITNNEPYKSFIHEAAWPTHYGSFLTS